MQIFLLSGKPFRRKEERIKPENKSNTQLREGKAPGKWLPAKKMFRQRKGVMSSHGGSSARCFNVHFI